MNIVHCHLKSKVKEDKIKRREEKSTKFTSTIFEKCRCVQDRKIRKGNWEARKMSPRVETKNNSYPQMKLWTKNYLFIYEVLAEVNKLKQKVK